MSRNPHRVRRDRWGRDLDLGDLSNENWLWRHIMPWTDHYTIAVCCLMALLAYESFRDGSLWWIFAVAAIGVNLWAMRRRHQNRRAMREQQYFFNAWYETEKLDGQEGP